MKATCSFDLEEVEVESLLKIPDSQDEATARRDLNTIRRNDAQGMKKKLKQRQRLLAPSSASYHSDSTFLKILMVVAILVGIGIFFNAGDRSNTPPTTYHSNFGVHEINNGKSTNEGLRLHPILDCPSFDKIAKSGNDEDEVPLTEFYEDESENAVLDLNSTNNAITMEDIENMKNRNFDGWKRPFDTRKEEKRSWVRRMFSSLQSGDSFFEVACGRGFNQLLTAEILKEEMNITDLNIYGIEYVPSSVDAANQILNVALEPLGSQLGSPICRGDATNLFFVPSNAFDLVFTGYIDQITDPLDLKSVLGREYEADDICNKTSWSKIKLAQLNQRMQEDWFAAWVVEMIRIAKPAKPIIVESVSMPICDSPSDWGGVSREWWTDAVERYGWDVDVDSIVIESLSKHVDDRYNVFMRKNNEA